MTKDVIKLLNKYNRNSYKPFYKYKIKFKCYTYISDIHFLS